MAQTTENFGNTEIVTLPRHILHEQRKFAPHSSGDLSMLLVAIQVGCKFVANAVRKAKLVNLTGLAAAGSQNIHAEQQKKLDVLANEIFINALEDSGKVCVMVSEENDEAFVVEPARRGGYSVVFDPLDGSSNIDCAVSIGTIFGVYHNAYTKGEIKDVLKPGTEMVAAGYCLYGSSVILVMATHNGVNGYTLDPSIGEFILSHPDIKIPARGKIYSINEGNAKYWYEPVTKYIESVKFPEDPKKAPYGSRYVGSMVADVHRTLLYGGVFGYPSDKKSAKGKLRILYECFPMAFVLEQAGGKATTGTKRILELHPSSIHDRSPIWLGSPEDIAEVEEFYKKFGADHPGAKPKA